MFHRANEKGVGIMHCWNWVDLNWVDLTASLHNTLMRVCEDQPTKYRYYWCGICGLEAVIGFIEDVELPKHSTNISKFLLLQQIMDGASHHPEHMLGCKQRVERFNSHKWVGFKETNYVGIDYHEDGKWMMINGVEPCQDRLVQFAECSVCGINAAEYRLGSSVYRKAEKTELCSTIRMRMALG